MMNHRNNILAKCNTNVDGVDASAITSFAIPPKIGDKVSVLINGKVGYLHIVDIIHSVQKSVIEGSVPYLEVELNVKRQIL